MPKKRSKKTSRHTKTHPHSSPSLFLSKKFILIFGTLACLLGIIFFATKQYIYPSSASNDSCIGTYDHVKGYCIVKRFCNDDPATGHCTYSPDCKPTNQESCFVENGAPTVTPTPTPKPITAVRQDCAYFGGVCATQLRNSPYTCINCSHGANPPSYCPANGNQFYLMKPSCPSGYKTIYPSGTTNGNKTNTCITVVRYLGSKNNVCQGDPGNTDPAFWGGPCCVPVGSSTPKYVNLSGRIYIDKNHNGRWDSGEPTYNNGATVTLSWSSTGNRPTKSNSSGVFSFSNIQVNTYTISVVASGYNKKTIRYYAGANSTSVNIGI